MAETRDKAIAVALIGLVGTLGTAWITTDHGGGGGGGGGGATTTPSFTFPPGPGDASLFLNKESGPGGATVLMSGEKFGANEAVKLFFHTEQVGSTTANAQGKFSNVAVTVPKSFSTFAPQQFFFRAQGSSPFHHAEAPFTITG